MRIAQAYYHEGATETPHLLDAEDNKVSFLIRCSVCHYGLCKLMEIARIPHDEQNEQNIIFIEPCPICLEAARRQVSPPVIPMNNIGSRVTGLEFIYD